MNELAKKRAQQVILLLASRSTNNRFNGKTRLYKAFYIAHLFFAKTNDETYLTEWPIVRMPNGPGIHDFGALIHDLVESGKLRVERGPDDGPYPPKYHFKATVEGDTGDLPEGAEEAISRALIYVDDKSGDDLSVLTHRHSKSWNDANDGDELPIYVDLLEDEEYKILKSQSEAASDMLGAILD